MANWCQNQIYFTGEESKVKEVTALFIQMQKECEITNAGQKPEFIKEVQQGYFFDVYAYDNDDQISFNTKWSPNVEDCVLIAKHFGLNFELNYQETSSDIYGKAIYTAGNEEAKTFDLSDEYFDLYEYNEDSDIYIYEGENYECEDDILEILFEKEFNQSY